MMTSKLEQIKLLREITATVIRHPALIDNHPELAMITEIVNEVEAKILQRGKVTLAEGRSG